jgi:hypothetical protein
MTHSTNPFPGDPDRSAIWEMLVPRDIAAFVASDWEMVAGDFIAARFTGLHAQTSRDPDDWTLAFPTLAAYRDEWLRQAAASAATRYAEDLEAAIHRATRLERIDLEGDSGLARKKFDGTVRLADGGQDRLNWQTLYLCRRDAGRWKIAGFVGYMAHR